MMQRLKFTKTLIVFLLSVMALYGASTSAHAAAPDTSDVKSLFSRTQAAAGQRDAGAAQNNMATPAATTSVTPAATPSAPPSAPPAATTSAPPAATPSTIPERPKSKSDILSELPKPSNATNVTLRGTRLSYTVNSTGTTVGDFYTGQLEAQGWTRYGLERRQENSDKSSTYLYRHDDDGHNLTVTISEEGNRSDADVVVEIH